jgi:N-acetyl-anhydromuramyl-L-alanine amidase AmpD
MLDLDGTVYQTLDLQERARQATIANDRSIGVEIAHMGAYPEPDDLARWYVPEETGGVRLQLPDSGEPSGIHTPAFVARPARPGLFEGTINGRRLWQYDFTEEQYNALTKLARTLQVALPRIAPTVPRSPDGRVLDRALTREEFAVYSGLLGHWHVQTNKSDPGPAFDWERVLGALTGPAP